MSTALALDHLRPEVREHAMERDEERIRRIRTDRFVKASLLLLAASWVLLGCTSPGGSAPMDVGSMAYPTPLHQGAIATTSNFGRARFDAGRMASPEPLAQGVIGRSTMPKQSFDTGNMAYPATLPQGTLATTILR